MTERELDGIYQRAKAEALADLPKNGSRAEIWDVFIMRLDMIGRKAVFEQMVQEADPPTPIQ